MIVVRELVRYTSENAKYSNASTQPSADILSLHELAEVGGIFAKGGGDFLVV